MTARKKTVKKKTVKKKTANKKTAKKGEELKTVEKTKRPKKKSSKKSSKKVEIVAETTSEPAAEELHEEGEHEESEIEEGMQEIARPIDDFDEVERQALVEALLFTHGEPLAPKRIAEVTHIPKSEVEDILESIKMRHSLEESGVELCNAGGKFQLRSKSSFAPFIQKLKAGRPRRLSPPALETLAIVAYRQPIVKSDVEKIRGVDATPTLKTLLERGFIKIVGHQPTVGQPALYGTTPRFLEIFGLASLSELPTLRDLKQLEAVPSDEATFDEDAERGAEKDVENELEKLEGLEPEIDQEVTLEEPLAANT